MEIRKKVFIIFWYFPGQCIENPCDTEIQPLAQSRSLPSDIYSSNDEGVLMASTNVFVLDPGDAPSKYL